MGRRRTDPNHPKWRVIDRLSARGIPVPRKLYVASASAVEKFETLELPNLLDTRPRKGQGNKNSRKPSKAMQQAHHASIQRSMRKKNDPKQKVKVEMKKPRVIPERPKPSECKHPEIRRGEIVMRKHSPSTGHTVQLVRCPSCLTLVRLEGRAKVA